MKKEKKNSAVQSAVA